MTHDILAKLWQLNLDLEIDFKNEILNKALKSLVDKCWTMMQMLIQLEIQLIDKLNFTLQTINIWDKMLERRRVAKLHPTKQTITSSELKTDNEILIHFVKRQQSGVTRPSIIRNSNCTYRWRTNCTLKTKITITSKCSKTKTGQGHYMK